MAKLKSNTRIFGTANVDGILTVGQVTPVAATSNTSGSLQVVGGLGMTGDLYANSITLSGNTITSNTSSIHLQENSGLYGAVKLSVLSDTGLVGALVDANSATVATADFGLKANNEQFNIRLEGRPAYKVKANSGTSEIQFAFRDSGGGLSNTIMVIANNGVLINAVSSTSNTTGALIVQGGVGVSGNVVANTARVDYLEIIAGANNAVLKDDETLTGWYYTGKSFSVAGQETAPSGIFFKPDGTKMYVCGSTGDDVNEYDLATAWDVSTATFLQTSVVLADSAPQDLFFKADGTKMFFIGSTADAVYEYPLTTAWNVATLSTNTSFSVAAQETGPVGLWFKPDGTKMYIVGNINDTVYEYDLGTAWSVNTASYLQSFSVAGQESTPVSLNFNSDGTIMYVMGSAGDDINRYNLSTPWNISTASFYNNFYVGFQDVTPAGLFINKESGIESAYMVGSSSDTVYQYRTESNSITLDTRNIFVTGSIYANTSFICSGPARVDGTLSAVDITGSTLTGAVAASTLTSSSTVTLSTTSQTITIGSGQTTGPILIGGTTATGTITVGQSSGTQSVNISGAPIVLTKGQLRFPATQNASTDANTLDDYEEGSWTPVLTRDGTAPTISYLVREGRYTKIGNLVTCWVVINSITVSAAGSGNNILTGLPFAIGTSTYGGTGGFGYNDAFVNTVYGVMMTGGTTQLYFRNGTRSSGNDNGGWASGGYLGLTITYMTT